MYMLIHLLITCTNSMYMLIHLFLIGDMVCSMYTGNKYEVIEVGVLQPTQVPQESLLVTLSILLVYVIYLRNPFYINHAVLLVK